MTGIQRKKKGQRKTKKKKLTWCQRCRRRICKWIYRRFKRCFKKQIFGVPDPQLEDYEVAGINLGDVRDKFTKTKDTKSIKSETKSTKNISVKKPSVITIYRNRKKSTASVPFKEKLINEFDNVSLIKPNISKLKSYVDDLKERNLYIGLSKDSLLNLNKSKREYFSKKAEEYEKKHGYNSYIDLKLLENLNKSELMKRLSVTSSKHDVVRDMLSDYKKKKFSITGLFSKSKVDINKLDKRDIQKLLQEYKNQKKRYSYVKQSKIKQFKSDLRAKIAQID
ncbi:uncharacterized protein LOC123699291 [Colias croceus]|uniref:uncharacterized protein LOC123699291 n=1 Tax=Colias crocea TaxID=72248 RepID=UPI001E27E2D3|nr:uncharacterized protein LOC123699291 [Colias croceus]